MVAPIDYSAGVADPFASALSGLKFGQALQEQQLRQEEINRERQRQQEAVRVQADFFKNPNPTLKDAARLATVLPKEQLVAMKPYFDSLGKEQRTGILKFNAQVLSALQTNTPVGIKMLRDRAAAERANNDEEEAQFYERIADAAEKQGGQIAFKAMVPVVASIPGAKDMFEAMSKAGTGTGEGFEIVSPDKAKELGLPPGNYQRNTSTGKIEVLNTGTQGEKFEILTPTQAKSLGLPADNTFQRDTVTGKITAVGGGGIKINMPPQIGSIPQDYRMVYDAQGRPSSMEVIPGSATARKLAEAETKEAAGVENTITQTQVVLEDIGALKKAIKNQKPADPVTGTLGAVVGEKGGVFAAGSARKSAEGRLATIQANIGFDRLKQMRAESPTGGALGNITEKELAFLQSVLGSIDLNQKDSDIVKNLERLEGIYNNVMKKAAAYPNAEKYGFKPGTTKPAESVSVGGRTYARPANFTDQQWADYKAAMGAK